MRVTLLLEGLDGGNGSENGLMHTIKTEHQQLVSTRCHIEHVLKEGGPRMYISVVSSTSAIELWVFANTTRVRGGGVSSPKRYYQPVRKKGQRSTLPSRMTGVWGPRPSSQPCMGGCLSKWPYSKMVSLQRTGTLINGAINTITTINRNIDRRAGAVLLVVGGGLDFDEDERGAAFMLDHLHGSKFTV